jgi:hypothetical protein
MRKLLLVAVALLAFGSFTLAEKVEAKWHCPKPTAEQKMDVGDVPDHVYWIGQGACTATGEGTLKEKTGQFTEFHDAWKATYNFHGRFNTTTASGDKVFYTYEGSSSTDMSKPETNKWKIVGGTGKYKDAKGSGGCSGKPAGDAFDWACTGTVTPGTK